MKLRNSYFYLSVCTLIAIFLTFSLSRFLLIAFAHNSSAEHPFPAPSIYRLLFVTHVRHLKRPLTLDTVQWCPIHANSPLLPIEKKQSSNDCLLCLCVAMTVKPLFDHSQWILLSQSYTSTPTVRSICCYLKESPPIYDGQLNRMQTKLSDIIS